MLDTEKKENLYDLTQSSGYPALLELMNELIRTQEQEVLRYDLHNKEEKGLIYLRCEIQGARKLKVALENHLRKIRVAASEA